MKRGRPTKYKRKFAEMLIKFFSIKPFKVEKIVSETRSGTKIIKKVRIPNEYPTFEAFAAKIGVNGDTLVEWANVKLETGKDEDGKSLFTSKHPEFSAAYKRAKDLQKNFIIQAGLLGLVQPLFGIFVAKNTTDMKDQQAVDHTTNGEKLEDKQIVVKVVSYKGSAPKQNE